MEIKLYYRISDGDVEIDTEKEHKERIKEDFEEEASDEYCSDFEDFLNTHYSAVELFYADETSKKIMFNGFKEQYSKDYDEDYEWGTMTKEV